MFEGTSRLSVVGLWGPVCLQGTSSILEEVVSGILFNRALTAEHQLGRMMARLFKQRSATVVVVWHCFNQYGIFIRHYLTTFSYWLVSTVTPKSTASLWTPLAFSLKCLRMISLVPLLRPFLSTLLSRV